MRTHAAPLAVLLLALAHCGPVDQGGSNSSSSPASTSGDLRPGEACTNDYDCAGGNSYCVSWNHGPYVCTLNCASDAACGSGQSCIRASDGYGYCEGGGSSGSGGGGSSSGGGAAPPTSNRQYTCACATGGSSAPTPSRTCNDSGYVSCGNLGCCPSSAPYMINGQCYSTADDACQQNQGVCPMTCG